LLALAYASLLAGVAGAWLPKMSLLALLTFPLAFAAWRGARDNADDVPALLPAMRLNVIVNLLTPALLAMGLLLSARA